MKGATMRFLFPALLLMTGAPGVWADEAPVPSCSVPAASPWITRWLAAWELTSREILHLPDAPAPSIVLFDSTCVYTTSGVAAGGAALGDGPAMQGAKLPWRAIAHDDSLTLPDGSRLPVQLMSFTRVDPQTGPYFVMAAPSYWERRGLGPENTGFTGVFLHEFAHTRQVQGMGHAIGPIDSA